MKTNSSSYLTGTKGSHHVLTFPKRKKIVVVDGEASDLKIYNYDPYDLMGHTEVVHRCRPRLHAATKYFTSERRLAAKTPYA